jgi:hypothetical protein
MEQLADHVFDSTNQSNGEHAVCDNRGSSLSPGAEPEDDPVSHSAGTAGADIVPGSVAATVDNSPTFVGLEATPIDPTTQSSEAT